MMKNPEDQRLEQSQALRRLAIEKSKEADRLIDAADALLKNQTPSEEALGMLRDATAEERARLREIKDPAARLSRARELGIK